MLATAAADLALSLEGIRFAHQFLFDLLLSFVYVSSTSFSFLGGRSRSGVSARIARKARRSPRDNEASLIPAHRSLARSCAFAEEAETRQKAAELVAFSGSLLLRSPRSPLKSLQSTNCTGVHDRIATKVVARVVFCCFVFGTHD